MSRNVFSNETQIQIGKRIREVRGSRTQAQFGDIIGVGRVAVANYEAGRRIPNEKILRKISEDSGKDIVWLLHGKVISENDVDDDTGLAIHNNYKRILEERNTSYIPKYAVSDDELLLLKCIRGVENPKVIVDFVLKNLREYTATWHRYSDLPFYEDKVANELEASIRKKRGVFEQGNDTDRSLYLTYLDSQFEKSEIEKIMNKKLD